MRSIDGGAARGAIHGPPFFYDETGARIGAELHEDSVWLLGRHA